MCGVSAWAQVRKRVHNKLLFAIWGCGSMSQLSQPQRLECNSAYEIVISDKISLSIARNCLWAVGAAQCLPAPEYAARLALKCCVHRQAIGRFDVAMWV